MEIGVFTDPHYSTRLSHIDTRNYSASLTKIGEAYDYFRNAGCELAVCLGDLADSDSSIEKELENIAKVGQVIRQSGIPTVCLMGNHDAFTLTPEQFYSALGLDAPSDMQIDGRTLMFLDFCYFRSGEHYKPGDSDWENCFYPDESGLKERLSACEGEVYIFSHQNIDPAVKQNHRIFNADSLFDLINQSGRVKCVFQGHFHPGVQSEYDGVKYVTLPAMCEHDGAFAVYEI